MNSIGALTNISDLKLEKVTGVRSQSEACAAM